MILVGAERVYEYLVPLSMMRIIAGCREKYGMMWKMYS